MRFIKLPSGNVVRAESVVSVEYARGGVDAMVVLEDGRKVLAGAGLAAIDETLERLCEASDD